MFLLGWFVCWKNIDRSYENLFWLFFDVYSFFFSWKAKSIYYSLYFISAGFPPRRRACSAAWGLQLNIPPPPIRYVCGWRFSYWSKVGAGGVWGAPRGEVRWRDVYVEARRTRGWGGRLHLASKLYIDVQSRFTPCNLSHTILDGSGVASKHRARMLHPAYLSG